MNELSSNVSEHLDRVHSSDSRSRSFRRKLRSQTFFGLSFLGLIVIVAPAALIILAVVKKALPYFSFSVFTTDTVGVIGGLKNEILGTLLITSGTALLAGFTGILGGLYLASYAPTRFGNFLRSSVEILAGVPSIAIGYVGYITLVVRFHWGFSLGAGLVALSILVVPYIVKTTEVAIKQVPTSYIEGAEALGVKDSVIMRRLTLKTALPGIATGLIVAIAISIGETAPLLYTAGYSAQNPSLALTHAPVGYLTYAVWTFYNQPVVAAQHLAMDAALLLIVGVLSLIIVARLVVALTQRYAETNR